jgi:hypothetical protein
VKPGATPRPVQGLSKLLDTATKYQEYGSSLVRRNACTVSFAHVSSIEPFDFKQGNRTQKFLTGELNPIILDRGIEPGNSRQGN